MKNYQYLVILLFVGFVGLRILFAVHALENEIKVQNDNYKLHSKTPCMTLPDNTPCWDKTVFKTLPGGYQQKQLRRICAFKSPKAQVWKDDE